VLTVHDRGDPGYETALRALAGRGEADLDAVEPDVRRIVDEVRRGGDEALRALTERFERRRQESLLIEPAVVSGAPGRVRPEVASALAEAAARIRRYHEHQLDHGFRYEEDGIELGERVRPVRAAGLYAPGGKARYPSTVLMTAVPAAVAGVRRIVLATPAPGDEVLAAAALAGVTEVVDAGGAQAIAALAYGTESIAPVDKIVGPGNIYVACAKRLVFGKVGIDSIAGPSEVLVLADDGADPRVVAADLLAQAEHDEQAYPLLVVLTRAQADAVCREVAAQLGSLPRRSIAEAAVRAHGVCFVAGDMEEAARIADLLAPEHLCLAVRDPAPLAGRLAAGAVFAGDHTPETAGDYAAGPSHVLPTGGAARYASPLGVRDFLVRTSIVGYTPDALARQADLLESLARLEGLEAHARAVSVRRPRRR
jgi:histidinol dehydrogenase